MEHGTEDVTGADLLIIRATLAFGREGEGILVVRELVGLSEDGEAHRLTYSYHFTYRSDFHFRYDRDPDNHPEMPEHKHVTPDERRVEWGPVRFREVVEEVYDTINDIEQEEDEG